MFFIIYLKSLKKYNNDNQIIKFNKNNYLSDNIKIRDIDPFFIIIHILILNKLVFI